MAKRIVNLAVTCDESRCSHHRLRPLVHVTGCAKSTWLLVALAAIACASLPRGATEVNLAKARSGSERGYAAYKQNCAGCHGERGESVSSAPRIMGEAALPEYPAERNANSDPGAGDQEMVRLQAQTRPAGAPWRDPFRTAQDLYGFVSKKMPLPAEKVGTLPSEQYWDIVNFMLLAHGVSVPAGGINASNASSVKLQVNQP